MHKTSLVLNTIGLAVSFFCFMHCVLVILVFAGLLAPTLLVISFFEDPSNHAMLIISGLTLATLSLITLNIAQSSEGNNWSERFQVNFERLYTPNYIVGVTFLSFSFIVEGIYSELSVILGALLLLSIHAQKLVKSN